MRPKDLIFKDPTRDSGEVMSEMLYPTYCPMSRARYARYVVKRGVARDDERHLRGTYDVVEVRTGIRDVQQVWSAVGDFELAALVAQWKHTGAVKRAAKKRAKLRELI